MQVSGDPDAVAAGEVTAVMRLARAVFNVNTRSITSVNDALTLTQLRTLVLVATSPVPVTTGIVAETLEIHVSTASRLTDRLIKAEWLQRNDSPLDRRYFIMTLTAEGTALLTATMARRRDSFAAILEQMAPEDRALVRTVFDAFSRAAGIGASSLDDAIVEPGGNARPGATGSQG